VTLGIIPGAGGTQRLPRITGLAIAIALIASGRRGKAAEAKRLRLIDKIATGDLPGAAGGPPRPVFWREARLSQVPAPAWVADVIERAVADAMQGARGRTAVKEAIESVRNATRMPFAEAAALERDTFQRLRQSEEAAALRYLFFAERAASRVDGVADA